MEEEGQVSGRREGLIKNCSPCSDKGTEKTATKYCYMCEASFCQECTEQHSVFLSKHRATDIESVDVGVSSTCQTGQCPHHGKPLNLYCKGDDTMCCESCITRGHKSCKEVVYLPTFAHTVLKEIDESGIKSKLRRTIEQLMVIKIMQQDTIASLQADMDKCLKEINDHHTALLKLLEDSVQSAKDQIKHTFERFSADLRRHHQDVEKNLVDLESSEKLLERNLCNDLTVFEGMKTYQNQLKVAEDVSTDSLKNLKVRGFSIVLDDRLHNLLRELESLVTVVKHAPAQVKKQYQIDVSVEGSNNNWGIYGSCVLNDGSILLADLGNKMLKCVDQHSLKVKDQLPMQDHPIDICVINHSEVLVTQKNNTVVVVSVRPRLTPNRNISMSQHCAYAAYSQDELFITDDNKTLSIYNMEGSLIREISTDSSGQELFSRSRHISVNATGDRVYIADQDKGLIILDREGQVQHKLVSDTIRRTFGLCQDGIGGLFVCGYESNNVLHVGADGQILTEVLASSDGLMKPVAMCYDRLRKRLTVTKEGSNAIHVCELE